MNNVKKPSNQYERYSKIIGELSSKCNDSNFKGITKGGLEEKRHYILEDNVHVYIGENGRFINISNAAPDHNVEKDGIAINLEKDNELDGCSFFIHGEIGNIIEGICIRYSKDFMYNYMVEEDTRDMWFLPSNMDAWKGDKARKIDYEYGELSSDIRTLLEDAIKRSENPKTKNTYMQALELYDKIIRIANRDEKITPTEALKNALRTTSVDKLNEAAIVEEEELHHGENKKGEINDG